MTATYKDVVNRFKKIVNCRKQIAIFVNNLIYLFIFVYLLS